MKNRVLSLIELSKKAVGWTVALLLFWMVVLSLVQLLLRWTMSSGISWADLHLRQLVLWIAILGGILATSDRRHIRIDLMDHYLKPALAKQVDIVLSAISGLGCIGLSWLAFRFLAEERSANVVIKGVLFGADVDQWVLLIIIPFGFAIMSLYFFLLIFKNQE